MEPALLGVAGGLEVALLGSGEGEEEVRRAAHGRFAAVAASLGTSASRLTVAERLHDWRSERDRYYRSERDRNYINTHRKG